MGDRVALDLHLWQRSQQRGFAVTRLRILLWSLLYNDIHGTVVSSCRQFLIPSLVLHLILIYMMLQPYQLAGPLEVVLCKPQLDVNLVCSLINLERDFQHRGEVGHITFLNKAGVILSYRRIAKDTSPRYLGIT